jgi:DNA integrity scanning protein DisA with diadenylate cyclase activity
MSWCCGLYLGAPGGFLLNEETPSSRLGVSEGSNYVRTVMRIAVQTRRIVITISRGDDTFVVIIPI